MLGKSHIKIGILSCAIVSTVPVITSSFLFNNKFSHMTSGINVAGLALAAVGALAVDADSQHSKINQMNVVTGVFNSGVGLIENILKTAISMIFSLGLGAFILYDPNVFIREFSKVDIFKPYAAQLTYVIALVLVISGIMGVRIARYIPLFGAVYRISEGLISGVASVLRKAWMLIIYIGGGIVVIYYNYTHMHDFRVYIIGLLLIFIAVFPHRTVLHSPEGIVLFSICVSYLLEKIGYKYLSIYFIIGYISHIYLGDIFTAEGVPVSSVPVIFEKTGLDMLLDKFEPYRRIKHILEIKLRIPPHFATGSTAGNIFESIFVLTLLLATILIFDKYGVHFRLI